MSTISTLEELYIEQLKDLYSAETQLVEALPKMAQAAHNAELKAAFLEHLELTREHVERLEQILDDLDEDAGRNTCEAMAGLIKESRKTMADHAPPVIKDAALIAAAQRVEHYEIAGYGCVRTYATLLGDDDAAETLQTTLDEESDTDQLLTDAAEKLNVQAEALSSRR
jgi:ferritin-like metal-binding protein YciE